MGAPKSAAYCPHDHAHYIHANANTQPRLWGVIIFWFTFIARWPVGWPGQHSLSGPRRRRRYPTEVAPKPEHRTLWSNKATLLIASFTIPCGTVWAQDRFVPTVKLFHEVLIEFQRAGDLNWMNGEWVSGAKSHQLQANPRLSTFRHFVAFSGSSKMVKAAAGLKICLSYLGGQWG